MKHLFIFECDLKEESYDFEKDGEKISGTSYYFQLCDDLSYKFGYKGKLKIKKEEYDKIKELIDNESEKTPVLGADKFGNIVIKRFTNSNLFA